MNKTNSGQSLHTNCTAQRRQLETKISAKDALIKKENEKLRTKISEIKRFYAELRKEISILKIENEKLKKLIIKLCGIEQRTIITQKYVRTNGNVCPVSEEEASRNDNAEQEYFMIVKEAEQTSISKEQEYCTDEGGTTPRNGMDTKRDKKRKAEQSPEMPELEKNVRKRKPELDIRGSDWNLVKINLSSKIKHKTMVSHEKMENSPRRQITKNPKTVKPPPIILSNVKH